MEAVSTIPNTTADHCRAAISRWLELMKHRSDCQPASGSREEDRYLRSWPLVVSVPGEPTSNRFAVALQSASGKGVGFLSHRPLEIGTAIWVHLYWCNEDVPPVPAQIRHVTRVEHGHLIGCAFLFERRHAFAHAIGDFHAA